MADVACCTCTSALRNAKWSSSLPRLISTPAVPPADGDAAPLAAVEDVVVVPARGASLVRGAVSVPAALLGSLDALALPSHAAPSPAPVADLALSDAWFGWYFAPGGVVLGPALLLTAFLLGQALFEKITGTGPKKK
mgnify:CR=1 FL=1